MSLGISGTLKDVRFKSVMKEGILTSFKGGLMVVRGWCKAWELEVGLVCDGLECDGLECVGVERDVAECDGVECDGFESEGLN